MNHGVNKLDGDILALMPWAFFLHTKSRILLPEGIWNCSSSSQFSPRHPHSLLGAEYLISWSISIANLSNRNNHPKMIRSALVIRITLLISAKSIRSVLISAEWEFYSVNGQNRRNMLLLGHAYFDYLYLDVNIWIKNIPTGHELCMITLQKNHILLHVAKKTCCWNQL